MIKIKILTFLGFTLALLTSCKKETVSTIPGPDEPIIYDVHIQPIFSTSCAISGCHTSSDMAAGLDLSEGHSFGNLVLIPSTTDPNILRVKPGYPDSSMLYLRITGARQPRMPLGGSPLPQEEIDLIKRWIFELTP